MKKVYIFQEQIPYSEERIRAVFTSKELAYSYMLDYLNYLEADAKEFLENDSLERELLRLKAIRKELPHILEWEENDKKYHWFFCEGFSLTEISCYESEEDLPKKDKEGEKAIEF